MRYQIRRLRKYPIEGFVFGLLTHDDKIDYARINLLVKTCKSKQKVFHMAFDEVNNKLEAIDKLASIGINRILTKGGSGTAENNLRQLYELNEYARGKLVIVAGGKVNDDNYLKIANSTGINQFHGRNLGMK
jgi:copper homeostasis protein